MEKNTLEDIIDINFLVLFSKKIENCSYTVAIAQKELSGIDLGEIGNVEDLHRIVFIDDECRNLLRCDLARTANIC